MPSHTVSERAKRTKRSKGPTRAKARKIAKDGKVRGKKLTKRQNRFMRARSR